MNKQYKVSIPKKDIDILTKAISRKIKRVLPEIDFYEERSVLLSLFSEELENFKESFAKDVNKLIEKETKEETNRNTIKQLKKLIKELKNA